jgi:hypothetical protein
MRGRLCLVDADPSRQTPSRQTLVFTFAGDARRACNRVTCYAQQRRDHTVIEHTGGTCAKNKLELVMLHLQRSIRSLLSK